MGFKTMQKTTMIEGSRATHLGAMLKIDDDFSANFC
jgi:hypothetical protein